MIISHKHRFIFIKTEKTAGTSFEIALSSICGTDDIITPISLKDEIYRKQLGFRGSQNYCIGPSEGKISKWFRGLSRSSDFYNHMPANEIKALVSPAVWNSYFKFCFERNPFDKMISWYYWAGQDYCCVNEFLKSEKSHELRGHGLYTIDGEIAVDRIYKYEELDEALKDFSRRIGLETPLQMPPKKLKGKSRKDTRHYRDILEMEDVKHIEKVYAKEMELMGYQF